MADSISPAPKILIIESDHSFGAKLSEAISKVGYHPIVKNTGAEGLKAMLDFIPRLVLLDVVLGDTDGYSFLIEKQKEPLLAKIPVFLVSAQGVPIHMQDVPQGSVSEFIVAPQAGVDDILEKINKQLKDIPMDTQTNDTQAVPTAKKKVLWVEDDKLIGTILAKKIISSGFDLYHAKNGEEALQILKQITPDLIAVDLMLPGMSGFDILQQVKMDESKKNIPTMVLSNLSKPSDVEKAKMLGAKKFLVKAATSLDQIVAEMKVACA